MQYGGCLPYNKESNASRLMTVNISNPLQSFRRYKYNNISRMPPIYIEERISISIFVVDGLVRLGVVNTAIDVARGCIQTSFPTYPNASH